MNKILSANDLLIKDCPHSRNALKKFLKKNKLLDYKCLECGIGNIWNDKNLVLQIDHINGINNDNRLENLRWLCPNCHSQTDTFAGRKTKKSSKQCIECNCKILPTSIRCRKCSSNLKIRPEKILWPNQEELQKLVWEKPRSILAKELGVSDKAISKRCRKLKLTQPERGYWMKKLGG